MKELVACGLDSKWCALLLAATATCLGCTGELSADGAAGDEPPEDDGAHHQATPEGEQINELRTNPEVIARCEADASSVGKSLVRRLTAGEYRATTEALLGGALQGTLPVEPRVDGFDNFGDAQGPTLELVEAYQQLASELGARAEENSSSVAPCADVPEVCATNFIDSFGRRAFRRPLTPDEVTRFTEVFAVGAEVSYARGVGLVVETIVQSAPFLYQIELGTGNPTGPLKLTPWELATRIAYLITGTSPDDTLLQAALDGTLSTQEGLLTQSARLHALPHARRKLGDLFDQWFKLRLLPGLTKHADVYPEFDADLGGMLREQALRLTEAVSWDPAAGGFSGLFSTNLSFSNERLALLYGTPGEGAELSAVELPADRAAGILTLPGLLALNARGDSSSPIHRGKFVREDLFCEHLPPPPNDVPSVPEVSPTASTRERFAQHTSDPSCSGCHELIDPMGFPFEHYDGIGRFRNEDAGRPIDSSGSLPETDVDRPVDGVVEMGQALAESDEVRRCLVTKYFRYAHGRHEQPEDVCTLIALDQAFEASGFVVAELPLALTRAATFGLRAREESP